MLWKEEVYGDWESHFGLGFLNPNEKSPNGDEKMMIYMMIKQDFLDHHHGVNHEE